MKPVVLWVLVANNSYAEIYEVKVGEVKPLHHLKFAEGRKKIHDIVTDKPGHNYSRMGSMGVGSHMLNTADAIRHHEQNLFAHDLVELCVKAKADHQFDRLVIIAPPQFLGELRHVMQLKSHHLPIEKEFHKDLPEGLSEAEKIAHVKDYLDI